MRTPQALQRVRGPLGPPRHCGVWCVLQYWHRMRRDLRGFSPARHIASMVSTQPHESQARVDERHEQNFGTMQSGSAAHRGFAWERS